MTKPIHEHIAQLGAVLSNPIRVRALNLLAQKPWTVKDLARELDQSLALTSAHLKVIGACRLVEKRMVGREVRCHLKDPEVLGLLVALNDVACTIFPEMREAVAVRRENDNLLEGMTLEQVYEAVKNDQLCLVDLRSEQEYCCGHLPHSLHYDATELRDPEISSLAAEKRPIVAYCRGPWCQTALNGVRELNSREIKTRNLGAGVVEWQARGLPLVTRS